MELLNQKFFEELAIPRPVGSENNRHIQKRLTAIGREMGYEVEELLFTCVDWKHSFSWLEDGKTRIEIFPSPFSRPADGEGELLFLDSAEALRSAEIEGKIVMLHGDIAAEPLMPENFPFFEVPEHKEIASLLEQGRPLAILSAMGRHPMCGLDPCPMFEDCYFSIPTAYVPASQLADIKRLNRGQIHIDSRTEPASGFQPVIHRDTSGNADTGIVIVCAHMDTAYGTCGALDNGTGLFAMLKLMERIAKWDGLPGQPRLNCDLQFIPFNGEDYADVSGQRAYLAQYPEMKNIRLVINIDGIAMAGSKNAISLYNIPPEFEAKIKEILEAYPGIQMGEPWFEGDHGMFVPHGIPAVAAVSSDLHALTEISHTRKDTPQKADLALAAELSDFLEKLLICWNEQF